MHKIILMTDLIFHKKKISECEFKGIETTQSERQK